MHLFQRLHLQHNAGPQAPPIAAARELGRRKARCIAARFLTPPVSHRTCGFHRIRLNTCGQSPGKNHAASVRISPAPPGIPRGQLARALGTFAPIFPQARGLRRPSSSWCPWLSHMQTPTPHPPPLRDIGIASGGSPFLLSTCLGMPRKASRVPPGRRTWNAGGGVLLSLPRPRLAAPQALHRGENRLTSVTTASDPARWQWS